MVKLSYTYDNSDGYWIQINTLEAKTSWDYTWWEKIVTSKDSEIRNDNIITELNSE